MSHPLPDETEQLMNAMHAVYVKIPDVQLGIASGAMPTDQQQDFGNLLVQLGELLREHASKRRAFPGLITKLDQDNGA
jgi:hypothetical protein